MGLHVDIMKLEPLSGTEQRLARVWLEHGSLVFDGPDEQYWRDALTQAVGRDPDENAERFLVELSERLDGTYLYATRPHTEADCGQEAQRAHEAAHA